jgi:phosphoribosylanthranilate isomerase
VSVKLKICGLTNAGDARVAVAAGADLAGVILWEPSPRACSVEGARAVREAVPANVELVGVFVDEEPERVEELVELLGLDRVQLHGQEPAGLLRRFGDATLRGIRDGDVSAVPPGVPVVYDRGFGEEPSDEALQEHWRTARAIAAERPVLLAGALHAGNVARAIAAARPFGVDVARGVERAPGFKDHDAVRRFAAAAKEASAS